jgi:hypothetical protein
MEIKERATTSKITKRKILRRLLAAASPSSSANVVLSNLAISIGSRQERLVDKWEVTRFWDYVPCRSGDSLELVA